MVQKNTKEGRKRVITGLQPTGTGELHIGNYCGSIYSIKKAIENKEFAKEDVYIFIADLHSMTVKNTNLRSKALNMIKSLYAFHLTDNLYIQSDIGAVCEGMWILSQFTTTGEMNRMTQFKDKQDATGSTIGLYTYPVLMAADILFMDAHQVPVGEDQTQHIEIVRDIGERVNHFAGKDLFVIPEMYIMENPVRIMSLNDISKKMSKSHPDGCLFLTDKEDVVRNKIKRAQTDSLPCPSSREDLAKRPAADNLMTIYAIISNQTIDSILEEYSGMQWSVFKEKLGDLLVAFTQNFQQQLQSIDEEEITNLIKNNSLKIKNQMENKIKETYDLFQEIC